MNIDSKEVFTEKLLDVCLSESDMEVSSMVACMLNMVAFMGVKSVWNGREGLTKSEAKSALHAALDEALTYHFDGRCSDA